MQLFKTEITTGTIVKAIGLIVAVFLFLKIWQVVASLFMAVVIAAALEPTLNWLERKKIPRIISVPFLYLVSLGAFLGVFYAILPSLFNEIYLLSQSLPGQYENFVQEFIHSGAFDGLGFLIPALDQLVVSLQDQLGQLIPNLFNFITAIFGGLISFLLIIVFSFYFSLSKNDSEKAIIFITPERHREYVSDLFKRMQKRTGRWLQAMFILATLMGVSTFAIMYLLGVKFALTLGLAAGLLEIVPYVGPFLAGLLIFSVASTESLALGFLAVLLFLLLQQLEQILIIPSVMSRAIGISPVAVLVAVLIGARLAGFWGVILAIPLTAALAEFARDLKSRKVF
ncbi:MAG: AI-2E family transporter [Candidatus Spechtbacterales bacterium]